MLVFIKVFTENTYRRMQFIVSSKKSEAAKGKMSLKTLRGRIKPSSFNKNEDSYFTINKLSYEITLLLSRESYVES